MMEKTRFILHLDRVQQTTPPMSEIQTPLRGKVIMPTSLVKEMGWNMAIAAFLHKKLPLQVLGNYTFEDSMVEEYTDYR